jgi:hypothetical protein
MASGMTSVARLPRNEAGNSVCIRRLRRLEPSLADCEVESTWSTWEDRQLTHM